MLCFEMIGSHARVRISSASIFFVFFCAGIPPKTLGIHYTIFCRTLLPKSALERQRKGDRPLALAGPSGPSRNVTEAAAGDPRQLPCLAAPGLMLLAHSGAAGGRSRRLVCSKA